MICFLVNTHTQTLKVNCESDGESKYSNVYMLYDPKFEKFKKKKRNTFLNTLDKLSSFNSNFLSRMNANKNLNN